MRLSILIAACAIGIAGCTGDATNGGANAPDTEEERNVNIDPKLEQFVSQARGDLARRLEIDEADIAVVDVGFVTWPNSALGCPEPDMMYTQALVPGYRILLRADGSNHHYHGALGAPPSHCPAERVTEPAKGSARSNDVT